MSRVRNTLHRRCGVMKPASAVLIMLASFGIAGGAEPPAAKTPAPSSKEFPLDLRQAWQKAGGQVGSMGRKPFAVRSPFAEMRFDQELEGLRDVVPAFRFIKWNPDVVRTLPSPEVPFGLDIRYVNLTDADMKELARHGTLQAWGFSL
jgi:hypothetical protein